MRIHTGKRNIMMLLLFKYDVPQNGDCFLIDSRQRLNLFIHVRQNDPFDRYRRRGNRMTSCQSGNGAKNEATQATP